jgi:transcriptional regulator with PAS, ATPase and Fis domain
MVEEGRFRKDLFYRLRVIHIHIPSLRERREDIIPIADYLLAQIAYKSSHSKFSLDTIAKKALLDYDWPGNVRELLNMLESAISSSNADTIYLSDLSFDADPEKRPTFTPHETSLSDILAQAEKETLLKALSSTNNNKSAAASLLGINRTFFHRKLKKHNLA